MSPRLMFSRKELNFLCGVLDTLAETRTAKIGLDDVKKVNTAIRQLRGYERTMVQSGMWGEEVIV